jgi:L-lactate dehydrogenase complex protein LldE
VSQPATGSPNETRERPRKVQLFHTCLVNEIDPEVGLATARVLERLGIEVEVPEAQTCCGQPAYNGGFHGDARKVARHSLNVLHATEGPIVIPSGSCADMVIHQYEVLFHDEPEWRRKAHTVAARSRELSQFLAEILEPGVCLAGLPAATRLAYHPSCHLLRGLGVRDQPKAVLRAVRGVELVDVADQEECCGFGGLFSVKNPEISGSMMERKLACVAASGADRLVSGDLGCLMHLGGGLRRQGSALKVQHIAQVIDEAQSAGVEGKPS